MSDRDGFEQVPYALPAGATEVVLVRHGASAAAVPGARFPLVDGRGDPPLSEAGHRQAEAIAARLAADPPSRLYVTNLRRTHETAAPLVAATGLEPIVVDDLAEVRLGEWEGGEYRVRAGRGDPIVRRMFAEQRWDVIPGGESMESLGGRVRASIERIVAETGPGAVAAAVVHGAVIGELCRQATDSRAFAFVHSDNGSISRLVVLADGRWQLRSFNDISHLAVRTAPIL
ncbi:MAG: 2,3-bisphosphoglycerate-dependent phosphoglycerate mutase [Baekduia sp.]|jgi:probable phosphoglycerate mutase|nr:2,3-bisphosphoglycerate-dependent phosphoglycerate mutase [Baekduia sp.]